PVNRSTLRHHTVLSHNSPSQTSCFVGSSSFFFECYGDHRDLHSFPTRRSSDLPCEAGSEGVGGSRDAEERHHLGAFLAIALVGGDRKSTRLNSSHVEISYAVFCLKKKKKSE